MSEIGLKAKRTARQRQAWEALADPSVRRVMYGGAKGGGKSYLLCLWLLTELWAMAAAANLPQTDKPPHVAWFGRKQATDLTGTTLQTWQEVIPAEYYQIRGSTDRHPRHICIDQRIALDFGGLDKSENIQKFNSAEYIIIAVDQAEEVTRNDVATLRASQRMILKDGKTRKPVLPRDKEGKVLLNPYDVEGELIEDVAKREPFTHWPYKELYTANPRQCWLKGEFIVDPKPNARFVSALPSDNPHLPSSYIQTLKEAYGHRPELLAAYMDGDWSAIEGADQVIKQAWLEEAKHRTCYAPRVKRYLVCDYARFGDDECVIYLMENADIIGKKILGKCSADELVRRLCTLSTQNDDCEIVIEVIGADMGGAVGDLCRAQGHKVIEFNPGNASLVKNSQKKPIYQNVRAEAWDKAAKILSSGILDEESNTLVVCNNMYKDLENQLTMVRYDFANNSDKVLIESKKSIKLRENRSPDHGDTYVIALWAWSKVSFKEDPDDKLGYKSKPTRKSKKSPMRC